MTQSKGALATLSIRAVSICAQLTFFVLIARSSSLEVVGLFAVASACWVLGRALLPMGWNVAVLRSVSVLRVAGEASRGNAVVKAALIETAILGGTLGTISVVVTSIVASQHLLEFALASGVALLWAELGILVAYLRALGDLIWSQICDGVLVYTVPLAICGLMVASGASISFLVISATYLASAVLSLICLTGVLYRRRVDSSGTSVNFLDIRPQRQLARRLWWNQAFSALSGRTSILLAAPVAGVATTAIVETGLRTQLVGATLAWAGGTVASPRYAVAHDKKLSDGARILNLVTWAALLPSMAVVILLAVWGEAILGILGSAYVGERSAITLMAFAAVVELPAATGGYFLMMTGRERIANIATLLQLGILVCLILSLGTIMGALGIAFAILISSASRTLVVMLSLRREGVLSPLAFGGLRILGTEISACLRSQS